MASPAVASCVDRAIQGVLDGYRVGVLAVDTETTSLRGSVIQAAIVELDARGNECELLCNIIAPPEGEHLDPRAVSVHGITWERISAEKVPTEAFLREVVARIASARAEGKVIVAHNASFDVARLNATLEAHGLEERLRVSDVLCTMRGAMQHCGLRSAQGRLRCPKNAELFSILHGGKRAEDCFEGSLHDAAVDARITAHSFLQGRRRGWWP